MKAVRDRVADGAAWLDREIPGWADRIELPTLELSEGCQCVLGQLNAWLKLPFGRIWSYGFDIDGQNESVFVFDELQHEWEIAIKERRA